MTLNVQSVSYYLLQLVISGKAIPLFFRLASNAFPDIGSVAIEKKNLKTKYHKKSRNRRPWYPQDDVKRSKCIILFAAVGYFG